VAFHKNSKKKVPALAKDLVSLWAPQKTKNKKMARTVVVIIYRAAIRCVVADVLAGELVLNEKLPNHSVFFDVIMFFRFIVASLARESYCL
jgi:hypothetical protein